MIRQIRRNLQGLCKFRRFVTQGLDLLCFHLSIDLWPVFAHSLAGVTACLSFYAFKELAGIEMDEGRAAVLRTLDHVFGAPRAVARLAVPQRDQRQVVI